MGEAFTILSLAFNFLRHLLIRNMRDTIYTYIYLEIEKLSGISNYSGLVVIKTVKYSNSAMLIEVYDVERFSTLRTLLSRTSKHLEENEEEGEEEEGISHKLPCL